MTGVIGIAVLVHRRNCVYRALVEHKYGEKEYLISDVMLWLLLLLFVVAPCSIFLRIPRKILTSRATIQHVVCLDELGDYGDSIAA